MTTTYLGAIADESARCVGVIYPVSEQELAATDQRESAGYKRCAIERADITMLDGRKETPEGLFWAYINHLTSSELPNNFPSPDFPVVQSYIDICIHGCLEIEGTYPTATGFAQIFIIPNDFQTGG